MIPASPDVVVVGGGIVGCSAAAFLADAGARVTLVERDGLASGASGANSGVVQHPFDPVLAQLYRATLAAYRDLSALDAGFRLPEAPAGLLYCSRDGATVRDIAAGLAADFPELAVEVLSGPMLERLEPCLAPGLWACRVEMGFPVQPGASTYAYATLAERSGATIRLGRAATLQLRGEAVIGVTIDGRRTACDAVLVAAGPWTPAIIDPTGQWLPIRESWGVVVETDLPAGPAHVLEEAEIGAAIGSHSDLPNGTAAEDLVDVSLVPLGGTATIGSTFLREQPRPEAWTERILARAATFVPSVADAPIRSVRACARPLSLDGRPLVGPLSDRRDLFVCAGHGPWGISTGPGSARLIVDEMLGRDPDIPAELDPLRFGSWYALAGG